jgi:very-short-patch-repair endonuclease
METTRDVFSFLTSQEYNLESPIAIEFCRLDRLEGNATLREHARLLMPSAIATSVKMNSDETRLSPAARRQARVLVAILPSVRDFEIARDRHWYRIPVGAVRKWVADRWPPERIAFYQPKIFGREAFAVRYYARVTGIRKAARRDLFPEEMAGNGVVTEYFQISLGPLRRLARPIRSKRFRRIVFIRTTWEKLMTARQINDLYDESPLEDWLWKELRRRKLAPERQEFVTANGRDYALDFAFYCAHGKLNVETDGDLWHCHPKRVPEDNRRDNDLQTDGWSLLRFNSYQLREEMESYCLPMILKNVSRLQRRRVPVKGKAAPGVRFAGVLNGRRLPYRAEKTYDVSVLRERYPSAYRRWTSEEEARLESLVLEGKTVRELAAYFGRNAGAIGSRLRKLGTAGQSSQALSQRAIMKFRG